MSPNLDDLRIDHTETPKRRAKRSRRWPWLVGAFVTAGGAFGLFHFIGNDVPEAASLVVDVAQVRGPGGEVAASFTAGGYLEVLPPGPTVVSVLVPGRMENLSVVEGSAVEPGQEIARLYAGGYERELSEKQAALTLAQARLTLLRAGFREEQITQARADVDAARAQLALAEVAHTRNERLLKIGAIPGKEVDASESGLKSAQARVAALEATLALRQRGTRSEDIAIGEANVQIAQSAVDHAQWRLDQCRITAPAGGMVLEQFTQVGAFLTPDDGSRGGKVISIYDPTCIQAWVDVNQRDIANVRVGQAVELRIEADPSRVYRGEVSRVLPRASLQKNTVKVNVAIQDPGPALRPELSVRITFLSGQGSNAPSGADVVLIPPDALMRSSGATSVFVLNGDKVAHRTVTLEEDATDMARVRGDLRPGDLVVLHPPASLADGMTVQTRTRSEQ